MPISRAEIVTESGTKLIDQVCDDWAGEQEVEHEGGQARVVFENGSCLLHAENAKLTVAVESLDEAGLDELEGVVESHLERVAGDEELQLIWEN